MSYDIASMEKTRSRRKTISFTIIYRKIKKHHFQ